VGGFVLLQTLVLFRELPSSEWLIGKRDSGPFRAVAEFTSGTYAGMGLISTPDLHHVPVRDLQVELRALGSSRASTAAAVSFFPPLPIPISHMPPDQYIVLALLKIGHGALEEYATHVDGVGDTAAMASAVLLGSAHHNLAIEVVGSEGPEVMRAVHALVEHSAVDSAELLHTTSELTAGFGDLAD
jgi:hypothetical protein